MFRPFFVAPKIKQKIITSKDADTPEKTSAQFFSLFE